MDPFDSMLRERVARVMAAAPGGVPPAVPSPARERSLLGLRRRRLGSALAGLAGVVVLVAATAGVARLLATPAVPSPGAAQADGPRTVWDSGDVRMSFDRLRIETEGKVFTAAGIEPRTVTSSSSPRNRTLEVVWDEAGVEQRMNIYLAANATHWWATEVRVYDGSKPGDWIGWGGRFSPWEDDRRPARRGSNASRLRAFGVPPGAEIIAASGDGRGFYDVAYRDARGQEHVVGCDRRSAPRPGDGRTWTWHDAPAGVCPSEPLDLGLFRTPRGETWSGDLDLVDGVGQSSGGGPVSGELHIRGMRLSAFD